MENITKMWHTVYIYTTALKKSLGRYKIGKADREANTIEEAAWLRINQQKTAATADDKFELICVFNADDTDIRSYDLESKLHELLKNYKVGGEWFETGTIIPIISAYNKLTTNVQRPNNYTLRKEQNDAINMAFNYFSRVGKVFLFNAIMRFGKTFAAYSLMKKMNAKKVLILTYKPAVGDSWETDLQDEVKFEDYEFLDAMNFSKSSPIVFPKNKSYVLFSSFQDILGKNLNGDIKDKWQKVIKNNFDLLIVDEVHFGFPSDKAQKLLQQINYKYRLDLSGTPINLMTSGYYSEEQIYSWSYIDEQEVKNANLENEAYKWLPKINLYTYKISDEIVRYLDVYEEKEYLNLNKFFGANDEFVFDHAASAEQFLNNLSNPEPRFLRSPFSDDEIKKHLKHMYWYMTSINSVKAMAKMLRDHSFFKRYKIIVAAGDNDGECLKTLEIVKQAIYQVDNQIGDNAGYIGTITISCGKLNTGVTVPKWNSVFFLNECESVQTYWQTAFRAKNPNKEDGKREAYIFDFNPNRALNMMYSFAEENGSNKTSNIEVIRRLLDTMRVLAYDDNHLELGDINYWLKKIVEVGADATRTIAKFDRDWLFNKHINVDEKMIEILNSVSKSGKGKIDPLIIAKSETAKGKTFDMQKLGKRGEFKDNKNKMNEIIDRARSVTAVIPNFLVVSEVQEERVEDIYDTKEAQIFKDICGIMPEEFKYLVENNLINKYKMNKAIESFHLMENL
jgi:superfamily II DNA or RNA helicase